MPLWVKVSGDAVIQCWDTPPPAGEEGWRDAVEVRPALVLNREVYGQHYFDVTKTPVEIVWPAHPWTVEDRKGTVLSKIEFLAKPVEGASEADRTAARALMLARIKAVEAAETHADLDAVV